MKGRQAGRPTKRVYASVVQWLEINKTGVKFSVWEKWKRKKKMLGTLTVSVGGIRWLPANGKARRRRSWDDVQHSMVIDLFVHNIDTGTPPPSERKISRVLTFRRRVSAECRACNLLISPTSSGYCHDCASYDPVAQIRSLSVGEVAPSPTWKSVLAP